MAGWKDPVRPSWPVVSTWQQVQPCMSHEHAETRLKVSEGSAMQSWNQRAVSILTPLCRDEPVFWMTTLRAAS